ncbi:MAG: hypothetical protein MZV49_27455 [Rhodopseudomonas palustris]|nr:hypothetical protein [Rhodopseudomonas palustris]
MDRLEIPPHPAQTERGGPGRAGRARALTPAQRDGDRRAASSEVRDMGVDVAIVIGAGNLWRGQGRAGNGHGPGHRRLHGHAGHGDERPGADGCARTAWA